MFIVEVKNLNINYGKNNVVKDLNFKVKKGDVLVVLGPNGAGKSSLFKAMMGLIKYEGIIKWNSKKISYLPPQESILRKELPPLSIKDFFLIKTKSLNNIKSMIKKIGLNEDILNKDFNQLSTGQFQRILIGWSLINNPEVLLFDEPVSGVDIKGSENIFSLIHKFWKNEKLTIIMITHELNLVWEHATNVLCLNKKGLCYGPPEKITPKMLNELYEKKVKIYKHRGEF